MEAFLAWFFAFMSNMVDGIVMIFSGIFFGIVKMFNVVEYVKIFREHATSFDVLAWIFAIVSVIIIIGIWVIGVYLLVLVIRKAIKIRRARVTQEDMFEEIADLHKQINRLVDEKDRVLALKVAQSGISAKALAEAISDINEKVYSKSNAEERNQTVAIQDKDVEQEVESDSRFIRLTEVDKKYLYYNAPQYTEDFTLKDLCENFRNFTCSRMGLYYDDKIIRCAFSGLAATKMILLQGISGTGKTSLPYSMGKFFTHDATIASVQPSWRDRTELFGYFNEFTKRFNETEVLKRIYESSFNDDINIIILDEMNIARVEYYFAEMLSILEMPDRNEWKLELVPASWPNDPIHLEDGKLKIPENIWYVGTANNDDSTYAVSDKVYDRAVAINLDSKGEAFEAPYTEPMNVGYTYLKKLFEEACMVYPVSKATLDKISKLDIFVIQKLRIAFGNRILKQLKEFVPVYVACGGTELEGVDYVLATKVFRKFESLNLSLVREELRELSVFLTKTFGKNSMTECQAYLERLQKLY